jgi:uncharacterized damage-inducible protein DinB
MYTWKKYYVVQADYQYWANNVLFDALDHLTDEARKSDQGLFFDSVHRTVDHMLQVSQSWFARLKGETWSGNYKQILQPEWRDLKQALRQEVRALQHWLDAREDDYFEERLTFVSSDGKPRAMWVRDALAHLHYHYVHHRGQVSAVATRLGAPCPEMDYVYYKRTMDSHLADYRTESAR